MGIPGLDQYLRNGNKGLPRVQLHERAKLYFDGDGWVHRYATGSCCCEVPHAPNYQALRQRVRDVFLGFCDTGYSVHVFFDGNSGRKKGATHLQRQRRSLKDARGDNEEKQRALLHFSMLKRATKAALKEAGIPVRQCCGEADQELSALAAVDGAVVVGEDSDFYVLANQYLPFKSLKPNTRDARCGATKKGIADLLHTTPEKLKWLAAIHGNDFTETHLLKEVARVPSLPAICQWLNEEHPSLRGVDVRGEAKEFATKLALSAETAFTNSASAGRYIAAFFERQLLTSLLSFTIEPPWQPPAFPDTFPPAFADAYKTGSISSQVSYVSLPNEPAVVRHAVLAETPLLPSVHAHTQLTRDAVYRALRPLVHKPIPAPSGRDEDSYYAVVEYTRDRGMGPLKLERRFTKGELAARRERGELSLHELWRAEGQAQNKAAVLLQFFPCVGSVKNAQNLLDSCSASRIAESKLNRDLLIVLLSVVAASSRVVTPLETAAFICGLTLCSCSIPLSNALKRIEPSPRFYYLSNLFQSTLHTILLANDVANKAILEPPIDDFLFIRLDHCLLVLNWFHNALFDPDLAFYFPADCVRDHIRWYSQEAVFGSAGADVAAALRAVEERQAEAAKGTPDPERKVCETLVQWTGGVLHQNDVSGEAGAYCVDTLEAFSGATGMSLGAAGDRAASGHAVCEVSVSDELLAGAPWEVRRLRTPREWFERPAAAPLGQRDFTTCTSSSLLFLTRTAVALLRGGELIVVDGKVGCTLAADLAILCPEHLRGSFVDLTGAGQVFVDLLHLRSSPSEIVVISSRAWYSGLSYCTQVQEAFSAHRAIFFLQSQVRKTDIDDSPTDTPVVFLSTTPPCIEGAPLHCCFDIPAPNTPEARRAYDLSFYKEQRILTQPCDLKRD